MATDRLDDLPERARDLLRGATDIHVHFAPDPFAERRMDARDLVRQAGEAGMAGLVLNATRYTLTATAPSPENPARLCSVNSTRYPSLIKINAVPVQIAVGKYSRNKLIRCGVFTTIQSKSRAGHTQH